MLPHTWTSTNLRFRAFAPIEAPEVKALFEANTRLQRRDPTFQTWPMEEYERLIADDATSQSRGNEALFYMRAITDGGGRLLGYFQLELDAPAKGRCWLPMLVLHPNAQSKGFGSETFSSILGVLRSIDGLVEMGLNVYAENKLALMFWFKCGFREILGIDDEDHLGRSYTCITLRRIISDTSARRTGRNGMNSVHLRRLGSHSRV